MSVLLLRHSSGRLMRIMVVRRPKARLGGIARNMRRAGWPVASIAVALALPRAQAETMATKTASLWGSLLLDHAASHSAAREPA